jgi:hypothetical protein
MKIKSICVLKHPHEAVWLTMRDRLPEITCLLEDIERVTVESRDEYRDGTVRLVNIWRARPNLPTTVANHITPDMLAWTDRAEYRPENFECHWILEPHFFRERIQCSGVTRYEPAMGGRGARITFDGDFELSTHALPGVPALLEGALARAIESFVTALVPKNFRKLTDAAGKFLESQRLARASAKARG